MAEPKARDVLLDPIFQRIVQGAVILGAVGVAVVVQGATSFLLTRLLSVEAPASACAVRAVDAASAQ